jgi:hypothetical protein
MLVTAALNVTRLTSEPVRISQTLHSGTGGGEHTNKSHGDTRRGVCELLTETNTG